jgi:hypothetical protein
MALCQVLAWIFYRSDIANAIDIKFYNCQIRSCIVASDW